MLHSAMLKNFLLVSTGGALGSSLRYAVSLLLPLFYSSAFPWPTFLVNFSGSFLISFLLGFFINDSMPLKLFFCTGILGGFTTYSSFNNENLQLLLQGQWFTALSYIFLSLFGCLFAGYLGFIFSH
ncbi:MAG: fluoride efflux transporter CrcB [Deltaproteobacteria bacterium]|nr:fluoride efflux transporter CrcB [Deltaproteobacteria bacterium]